MAGVRREPGDDIGGYTVVETLGRGGSGAVYRVTDAGGAEFALKLVDAREDDVAARRLEREVHALQSLRHSAVPRVLDAELDGDATFVVFEYIPGVSLWHHVQDHGPLRDEALATFAERTASALDAVHAAGVVHRDVTPSNIMISPDGPVLIDFGLSHRADDERLTRDGLVSGTAGYVAPEVIDGAEPGPVADRWSWAATVAYAMSGQAPFGSGTGAISRTLEAIVQLPDVPGADALAAALGRDLAVRPEPRDVVAALKGEVVLSPTEAYPTSMDPTVVAAGATTVLTSPAFDDAVSGEWETHALSHADQDLVDDADVSDDDAFDEEDFDREPVARRPVMIGAWLLAASAVAALAPVLAFAVLAVSSIVSRTWQRRAVALDSVRARRGLRRGDAALQTIGLPWHLLRALAECAPAILAAAALGFGVGWLGWWLVTTERMAFIGVGEQTWALAAAWVAGALAAALMLWWGPMMGLTREGAHRIAAAVAPTRGVAAAWVAVALTGVGVVVLAVYLDAQPWWWPLPTPPT